MELRTLRDNVKRTFPKRLRVLKTGRHSGRSGSRRARNRAEAHQSRLYSEHAFVYDKTFGRFFSDRIKQVVESLNISSGARVLELGVGTGASFAAYPRDCEVIGIDLTADMLVQRHSCR